MIQLLQKPLLLILLIINCSDILLGQNLNALNFDGVDDNIQLTHFDRPTVFTLEAWVKNSTMVNDGDIVSWSNSGGTYSAEFLQTDDSVYYAEWSDPNWCTSYGANISDGNWHHIAIVRNGDGTNNLSVYKDGQLQGTNTVNCYGQTNDLRIGAENYTTIQRFYSGSLDELRIWNYARTQNEIKQQMNSSMTGTETGLIINYTFNQGVANGNNSSVGTLTDSGPNGNNGTLNNFALTGSTSNWIGGFVAITQIIQNSFKDQFVVYPNPTEGNLEVKFQSPHSNLTARLLNSTAQVIESKSFQNANSVQFDINQPNGIYLMEISDENGNMAIIKVVKEK